ncbi:MAG: cobalamin biosynthesis protein, partial [Paracoccaceae bacterium]|nr:cobalamin biosynthesis protein [Paracoccaceae bacterium]
MPALVLLAMLIDAATGEPKWLWSRLPHPAVLIGRCVGVLDRGMNQGKQRKLRGALAILILSGGAFGLGLLINNLPY